LFTDKALKDGDEEHRVNEETDKQQPVQQVAVAKKKYIKYPTEDLDVVLSQREKAKRVAANGHAMSVRPALNTELALDSSTFESLLMTWSFFTAFGPPLKLSTFTL